MEVPALLEDLCVAEVLGKMRMHQPGSAENFAYGHDVEIAY